MANNFTEQEKKYQNDLTRARIADLNKIAKQKVKQAVKKEVKKKVKKLILKNLWKNPFFWTVVGYVLLGLGIILLIFILIYFITNPCEVLNVVGDWWPDFVGSACETVTGTGT